MATTLGERKAAMTQIQVTLKTARDQVSQCGTILTSAKMQLDNLPTTLKTLLEDIASDKGSDKIANQVIASEAEIMIAEVSGLSAEVDAKLKAMQAAG